MTKNLNRDEIAGYSFYMCDICYGNGREDEFTKLPCGDRFMTECLRDYWTTQVNTNTLELIQCPAVNCREKPSQEVIKMVIGTDCFDKFEKVR